MPSDADRYQDLSRIREAIARAFDMTLPSATTINGQVEIIVQAIYDAAADRPRPTSTSATTDKRPTRELAVPSKYTRAS